MKKTSLHVLIIVLLDCVRVIPKRLICMQAYVGIQSYLVLDSYPGQPAAVYPSDFLLCEHCLKDDSHLLRVDVVIQVSYNHIQKYTSCTQTRDLGVCLSCKNLVRSWQDVLARHLVTFLQALASRSCKMSFKIVEDQQTPQSRERQIFSGYFLPEASNIRNGKSCSCSVSAKLQN